MGQKLYLECYSGISGDMTVAALSGLMKDRTPLFRVLDHMPVEGFSYELKQVKIRDRRLGFFGKTGCTA